ncbi:MAG: cobalt-precorrin-8 methylmutase [Euryarchaeota archaeon]|jgi:precorrin-8X/cobalt-precorrin-8 methylmutase|uniref:cobalt-precorrin-8 methylmutase n=1 Tax=Methanobacterium sp. MZD130B TaxID=3394378 RepID=UPI0017521B28|nr:cobalt-precorrin-8 methylmutase [Euryarchaeota archaeon]HHT18201.1 cobalt-precorrin-8 methylmutase [Methanobacterium sp.]
MSMGASTKQGYEIAEKSRKIVKSLIDSKTKDLTPEERSIVERIVHSTADTEYADITRMSSNFVEKSLEAIYNGKEILTDINMVKTGINKYKGNIRCYIGDELTIKLAKKKEITRAAAAMELAALNGFDGVVVIGNAPTALWKVIELVNSGSMDVKSVIGVPVGFVGAAESKQALQETSIPYLVTEGPKGGTPVAVAAVNSLINIIRSE